MTHRTGFYGDAVLSNSQLDTDFDSETTGSIAKRQLIVTVDPSATSDRKLTARRDEVLYVSANNMEPTSFLNAHTASVGINSLGNVDTAVGYNSVYSFTSDADVSSAYGYTVNVSQISTNNTVGTFYGYVFPDMTGVSNQGNISNKVAFANLDPEAYIINYGYTVNSLGGQTAPANHPGMIPGVYYTGEHSLTVTKSINSNTFYFVPVYIPHNCTVDTLAVNVHSGTLTGGSVQLGIYKTLNGKINGAVVTGLATATSTGVKSVNIGQKIPSGTYLLSICSNINMNIVGGVPVGGNNSSNLYGQTSVPSTGVSPTQLVYNGLVGTHGTEPTFDVYPTLGSDEAWPLVWLTVETPA